LCVTAHDWAKTKYRLVGSRDLLPVRMPKGKKCAFAYCVNMDAVALWIGGGFLATPLPTTISKGEFGPREGAGRILDVLKKLDIKCSFGIPVHTAESFPEICKRVVAEGHEVMYHGYMHEDVSKMPKEKEEAVMRRGLATLKNVLGVDAVGYDQHSSDVSPNTHELLEKLGFEYAITEMASEFLPYRIRVGDHVPLDGPMKHGRETKVVQIPWSWFLDDFPYHDYIWGTQTGLRTPREVISIYKDFFHYMYENVPGGVMRLVNHDQVSGHAHVIPRLEEFLRYVKSFPDVWVATCKEIADAYVD